MDETVPGEVVESMELVIPLTGEIVSLDDPATCARVLSEIRELETQLRELKGYLAEALMEESRRQGTKTLHFSGIQAKINTPVEISWDYEVLLELQAAGLPEERFNDLVTMDCQYRVNGSVAKSVSSSNEIYAEIITRAQARIPKSPSVSIKAMVGSSK